MTGSNLASGAGSSVKNALCVRGGVPERMPTLRSLEVYPIDLFDVLGLIAPVSGVEDSLAAEADASEPGSMVLSGYLKVAMAPSQDTDALRVAAKLCAPMALTTRHAACSPV
jgi:hypothetical protein